MAAQASHYSCSQTEKTKELISTPWTPPGRNPTGRTPITNLDQRGIGQRKEGNACQGLPMPSYWNCAPSRGSKPRKMREEVVTGRKIET